MKRFCIVIAFLLLTVPAASADQDVLINDGLNGIPLDFNGFVAAITGIPEVIIDLVIGGDDDPILTADVGNDVFQNEGVLGDLVFTGGA